MKTECKVYSEVLQRHGVRPTAVRLLVYRCLTELHDTFSMTEVEERLDRIDKSTVFRTLTLFAGHHLVHELEDGSGSKKYCLCRNDHDCRIDELHCHFFCESCRKTFCLDGTVVPVVPYPSGFRLERIDYLMKGVCATCAAREK